METPIISEQKEKLAQDLQKYLPVPSPFMVWRYDEEPALRISKTMNNFRSFSEVEAHFVAGRYYISDFYYLMAGACYRYATTDAIYRLVEFWKRKDVRDASKEKRTLLNIPNPESSISTRLKMLSKEGLLVRYDMCLDPSYYSVQDNDDARIIVPVYRTTSNGYAVYCASLEKHPVSFNNRTPFLSEAEQLRWVNNSILTAAFLGLPWVRDVKFVYNVEAGRKKIQLMSYLKVQNPSKPEHDCYLILESVNLQTNETVVTLDNRAESTGERIRDVIYSIPELEKKTGKPHFAVFNVESVGALRFLHKILASIKDLPLDRKILVTTGTILYSKQIVEKGNYGEMANSFLEYNGTKFTGANYYFLQGFDH